MDYKLSRNHNSSTGKQRAQDQLHTARNKIKNMAMLSLPAGKTKEDMERAEKARESATVTEASSKTGDDNKPIDASQLEVKPVPSLPAVVLQWKEPSDHILRMREMAQQSGRGYKRRMASVQGRKPVVYRDHM